MSSFRGPIAHEPKKDRPLLWIGVAIGLFAFYTHMMLGTEVPAGFHATPGANQVVLLSDTTCTYCDDAKALLANAHVPYAEYDVQTSKKGRSMYKKLHGRGVPILIINGHVIKGYDKSRILAALH